MKSIVLALALMCLLQAFPATSMAQLDILEKFKSVIDSKDHIKASFPDKTDLFVVPVDGEYQVYSKHVDSGQRTNIMTLKRLTAVSQFADLEVAPAFQKRVHMMTIDTGKPLSENRLTNWLLVADDTHYYFLRKVTGGIKTFTLNGVPASGRAISATYFQHEGQFFYLLSINDETPRTYLFSPNADEPLATFPYYVRVNHQGANQFEITGNKITWTTPEAAKHGVLEIPKVDATPMNELHGAWERRRHGAEQLLHQTNQMSPAAPANPREGARNVSQQQPAAQATVPQPPAPPQTNKTFEYAGHQYELYTDNKGTYVKRVKDGKTVHIATKVLPFEKAARQDLPSGYIIENGILKIAGSPRGIALDFFNSEASYEPHGCYDESLKNLEDKLANFKLDMEEALALPDSRKEIVEQALKRLRAPKKNSVLFTEGYGDRGYVIQTIVEKLPPTWRVLKLEEGRLAGEDLKYSGKFEEVMETVKQASDTAPIVLVREDLHTLKGFGEADGKKKDFFAAIRSYIAEGRIRIIGTSGPEFDEQIHDSVLKDGFYRVALPDLKHDEVLQFLKNVWNQQKKFAAPSDELLETVIDLAANFNVTLGDPDRSIALLDAFLETLSEHAEAGQHADPNDLGLLKRAAKDFYRADPDQREATVIKEKLRKFEQSIREYGIVGHDHALANLKEIVQNSMAETSKNPGPKMAYFIDGPPGTGKTELAKAASAAGGWGFEYIVMNTSMTADDLLGQIYRILARDAHALIMLDEIEKANYHALESLLQMFSNEYFSVNIKLDGNTTRSVRASVKHAKFFIAGNILGQLITHWWSGMTEEQRNAIRDPRKAFLKSFRAADGQEGETGARATIQSKIPSPLLDRFFLDFAFPSTRAQIKGILQNKMTSMIKSFQKNHKITVTPVGWNEYIDSIADFAIKENMSVRSMLRLTVESTGNFSSHLSEMFLSNTFERGRNYTLNLKFDPSRYVDETIAASCASEMATLDAAAAAP